MLEKLKLGQIESNIWKYMILLITNKKAYAAIIGLYYLSIEGVESQHIGIILLFSSIASCLFEIPSGYISDKIGHKNMLVVSKLLFIISCLGFILSNNLVGLIISGVIYSIACACLSGTGAAFMHDTLKLLGKENKFAKIVGKQESIGFGLSILFSSVGPLLIPISYKAPFILTLFFDIIGFIAAINLIAVKRTKEEKKELYKTSFKDVLIEAKKINYLPVAVLFGFVTGVLIALQVYRSPYQENIGIDVIWMGVYFAIGKILTAIILNYSEQVEKVLSDIYKFQRFQIIFFSLTLYIMYLANNIYVTIIVFILINGLQWGISQVGVSLNLKIIEESKFKATMLSLKGQIQEITVAIVSVITGVMINIYSYQTAFLVIGVGFFVVSMVLYYNILRSNKRREAYVQN